MEEAKEFRELRLERGFDASRPEPPRVRAWPLLGSSIPFLRDPQRHMLDAYRMHGPVYRMDMGPQPYVVIAGLEGTAFAASKEGRKLVSSEGVWSESARVTGADPHAIMTNVDGARHAELRGLFRAGMGKTAAIETLAQSLTFAEAALHEAAQSGRAHDSVAFSRALVFEQLGHAMAGSAPPAMFSAADAVLKAIVRGVRVPLLRKLPRSPSLRRAARETRSIAMGILASPAQHTFLREVRQGVAAGIFAATDLPAIMLTPFIAGLDTMAHTFAFVLYRLAQHPEWRTRLRAEVDRAVARTGALDADAIAACEELGYFVQEVMRIHPLSPAIIRSAREDFALNGLQIRAGSALFVPHTLPHFMEEVYPDPHRFDPMRFHPDRGEHKGAGRYTPFGAGPHVCLGAGSAEVLLRANTAMVLHRAEVAQADPRYTLEVSNLSGACPKGFRVRITMRTSEHATTREDVRPVTLVH